VSLIRCSGFLNKAVMGFQVIIRLGSTPWCRYRNRHRPRHENPIQIPPAMPTNNPAINLVTNPATPRFSLRICIFDVGGDAVIAVCNSEICIFLPLRSSHISSEGMSVSIYAVTFRTKFRNYRNIVITLRLPLCPFQFCAVRRSRTSGVPMCLH